MNGDIQVPEDRLRSLEMGFAELKGVVTTQLGTLTEAVNKIGNDHEARLRAVEQRVWSAAGWLSGASLFLSLAVSIALTLFVG